MGAWGFVSEFLEDLAQEIGAKHPRPRYAGRPAAASPATGLMKRHQAEQAKLIDDALAIGKPLLGRIGSRRAEQESVAGRKKKV